MEIKFNTERGRWEVYNELPRLRAGEPQPDYVCAELTDAAAYVERVRRADDEHDPA